MSRLLLCPFFGCNIWRIDRLLRKCGVHVGKTLEGERESEEARTLGNMRPSWCSCTGYSMRRHDRPNRNENELSLLKTLTRQSFVRFHRVNTYQM